MSGPMSPEQRQREQTAGVLSIRDITALLKVSHRTRALRHLQPEQERPRRDGPNDSRTPTSPRRHANQGLGVGIQIAQA